MQSRAHIVIGAQSRVPAPVCGVVLEGGTLTSSAGSRLRAPSTTVPWWGWCGPEFVAEGLVVGALLGPEGTGDPCGGGRWSLQGRSDLVPSTGWWGMAGWVGRCLVVG